MTHLANAITASRFVFAAVMLLSEPLSAPFWAGYVCGGLSDLLDGPVARRLHQQSAFGAKLDSAADLVFILCTCIAVFRGVAFPTWVLIGGGTIALVRFISYGVGYRKYRTFATVHTWLNKATGFLLFLFPVLFALLGIGAACGIICGVAFITAAEELVITIRSRELNRDRKSLFRAGKPA
jgi:CDP-diacylglycerol--glycerol-3-phosphate 3-phosphatidyltransferase